MVRFWLTRGAALSAVLLAVSAPAVGARQHKAMPRVFTVAGSPFAERLGEGVPATMAEVRPFDVASAPDCGFVLAERYSGRVRRVSAGGMITTLAGNGHPGFAGDGGPGAAAEFLYGRGVALMPDGGTLVADEYNRRVRRISPDGMVTTVAGDGTTGFAGDGGPATDAELGLPVAVAAIADGSFLIADALNDRVRRVGPEGTITTVAGNGRPGSSGDGGPATAAQIGFPVGVAATPDGEILIADQYGATVRRVAADGTISTVAGTGRPGFSGDGGPAVNAQLDYPRGVASLPDGGVLIADQGNARVRRVRPDGTIMTLADTRSLGGPRALSLTPDGGVLIATPRGVEFIDAHLPRLPTAGPPCRRLMVAIMRAPKRAHAGSRVSLRFMASRRGRAELMIRPMRPHRGDASAASAMRMTAMVRGRGTRFTFRAPERSGPYELELLARTATHQVASAQAEMRVTNGS